MSCSDLILKYDLWYPVQSDRYGAPRASPSFVSYLLINEAVGPTGKSQLALIDVPSHPELAIYAVWDDRVLSRLVLLNLLNRNTTTPAGDVEKQSFSIDVSKYLLQSGGGRVKRMTAAGMDSKDSHNVFWAGQSYANGVAEGEEVVETLNNGKVTVRGSEGLIVFL